MQRIRKKRPDFRQSLWAGGSCTYRLRDYGKRHLCPVFYRFPGQWQNHQFPELEKILFDFLPVCVHKAFFYRNLDADRLKEAIELAEDQEYIRRELAKRSLAAFVNDGAILPRESGISSRPMKNSVPFVSPENLRISMDMPHRGTITGMGIPAASH